MVYWQIRANLSHLEAVSGSGAKSAMMSQENPLYHCQVGAGLIPLASRGTHRAISSSTLLESTGTGNALNLTFWLVLIHRFNPQRFLDI